MLARVIVCFSLSLLVAAGAAAQQLAPPPAPSSENPLPAPQVSPPAEEQPPSRVFCEQNVIYRLARPTSVADQYRRFLGAWSDAAWDARTCAALVVEDVKPDGTASIVYVVGPLGSASTVPGAVLHGTGIIRDGQLRFQNTDGSQYAFRLGLVDMVGHWINAAGESFQATFKETP